MGIGLARNGPPAPVPTPVLPNLAAAIGLIPNETVRAACGAPLALTLHGATSHAVGNGHRFMLRAGRQEQRQERPGAFGTQVNCRAKAPLTAPERFGCRVPC